MDNNKKPTQDDWTELYGPMITSAEPVWEESKACSCGAHITYGPSCDLSFHSIYCELNPDYKEKK